VQPCLVSNCRFAAPEVRRDITDRRADRSQLAKATERIGSPGIAMAHRESMPRRAASGKDERTHASYFMTGMTYSATPRVPVGQRAVTVFRRV
jgi:hypothetical protein